MNSVKFLGLLLVLPAVAGCPTRIVYDDAGMVGGMGEAGSGGSSGAAGRESSGGSAGRSDVPGTGDTAGTSGVTGGGTGGTGTGAAGATGTGGAGSCTSTQHTCSGSCVDNNSVQNCGTTSCSVCPTVNGAFATCDGNECRYSCTGATPHDCGGGLCVGSTQCCTNTDCPANAGQTGTCDTGSHSCSYNCPATGNSKSCTVNGTTSCISPSACCTNNDCPGNCMVCNSSHACVAATNQEDPNGRCLGTCDATGACKSKQGQACNTVPGLCVSGTVCSPDGVCCNTACSGPCVACDLPGFQGTCTNLALNSTPHSNHPSCGGSGTCAGACGSSGACSFPTSVCASATCSGTSLVGQSTCSNGSCVAPAAQVCANELVCSAGACKTSCASDTDCLPNYFCGAGSCHQAATAVACGAGFTCAILYDGTVRCWGRNYNMELGTGSASNPSRPVEVTGLPKPATALAIGSDFGCALLNDGSVWCWGNDVLGELGNGTFSTLTGPAGYAPAQVKNLASPVTAIAAGYYHACAVVNKATVWCWGNNAQAELGSGTPTTSTPAGISLPVQAKVGSGTIVTVAAGSEQSYALFGTGTLIESWGANESGELGDGSSTPTTAIQDVGLTVPAVSVTSGTDAHLGCALGSDGGVYCWGDGSDGALGSSSPSANQSSPVKIVGLPTTATQISASRETACAILHNGTLYCWGGNEDGEAGKASPSNFATPMQVTGFTGTPVSVAVGYTHTCALTNNGSVWCWGGDDTGQLGDGQTVSSPTPIQVNNW